MKRVSRDRKRTSKTSRKGRGHLSSPLGRSSPTPAQFATGVFPHPVAGPSTYLAGSRGIPVPQSEALFRVAVKSFELGARAFQQQKYARAKEIFARLAATPVVGVAERARVHLRLCEQKLSRPSPPPRSVEELYAAGVGALNSRRLDESVAYLNKAAKSAPKLEHVQYALAAAYALRGNTPAALQHLQEAILLRPQNRIQARYDEDFRSLAAHARFEELVSDSNGTHLPGDARSPQDQHLAT